MPATQALTNVDLLLSVGIQIPVVAIFIWFVLKIFGKFLEYLQTQSKLWSEDTTKRDEQWRLFLEREQSRSISAYNLVASEMKAMSDCMKGLGERLENYGDVLTNHDERVNLLSQRLEKFTDQYSRFQGEYQSSHPFSVK